MTNSNESDRSLKINLKKNHTKMNTNQTSLYTLESQKKTSIKAYHDSPTPSNNNRPRVNPIIKGCRSRAYRLSQCTLDRAGNKERAAHKAHRNELNIAFTGVIAPSFGSLWLNKKATCAHQRTPAKAAQEERPEAAALSFE